MVCVLTSDFRVAKGNESAERKQRAFLIVYGVVEHQPHFLWCVNFNLVRLGIRHGNQVSFCFPLRKRLLYIAGPVEKRLEVAGSVTPAVGAVGPFSDPFINLCRCELVNESREFLSEFRDVFFLTVLM